MAQRGPDLWLTAGKALVVADVEITLEALCARTGKTRGSFYHHFASVEAYRSALLEHWRRQATLDIIAQVDGLGSDRIDRLNAMATREDHRFERALRALGVWHADIGRSVEEVDQLREAYLVRLAREDLKLDAETAQAVARLGMALFIAGQMRAPDDLEGFNVAAETWLMAQLLPQAPGR
ncbi:tetR family transcriptional regulator [Asticcacaulis biprosthecium C19]|uniref:TetR family transcriptional regulator n=1 Tax=Asticcacaulis biprosthecium C19 TaxID=715226 RepID=F4QSQ0_9CAUL|nr:TetR/AcrR family transcriptional regulator [Asticcacaulis biprosthecium]EGF89770.1 tetR family transcriptional regulator [Asticcacaulis biprosthecium C19]